MFVGCHKPNIAFKGGVLFTRSLRDHDSRLTGHTIHKHIAFDWMEEK